MTDDEVNEIIASFMSCKYSKVVGLVDCGGKISHEYTISLDLLIPVWLKMKGISKLSFHVNRKENFPFRIRKIGNRAIGRGVTHKDASSVQQTIQQAAAHATAIAITELNK